jgi:hypothetical protein
MHHPGEVNPAGPGVLLDNLNVWSPRQFQRRLARPAPRAYRSAKSAHSLQLTPDIPLPLPP